MDWQLTSIFRTFWSDPLKLNFIKAEHTKLHVDQMRMNFPVERDGVLLSEAVSFYRK